MANPQILRSFLRCYDTCSTNDPSFKIGCCQVRFSVLIFEQLSHHLQCTGCNTCVSLPRWPGVESPISWLDYAKVTGVGVTNQITHLCQRVRGWSQQSADLSLPRWLRLESSSDELSLPRVLGWCHQSADLSLARGWGRSHQSDDTSLPRWLGVESPIRWLFSAKGSGDGVNNQLTRLCPELKIAWKIAQTQFF